MAQVKIYGFAEQLRCYREEISDIIHSSVMDAFHYPAEKRVHRFFPMEKKDIIFTLDRSEKYTIIEISIFQGRSIKAKKKLIAFLFERINRELNISPQDVEITIFETPQQNWGIRGLPGDEIDLNYKVEV